MSSAHRPTWAPAIGKAGKSGSKIVSARDLASQTRLKFRQPGQGSTTDLARRDLKRELIEAEHASAARKAKGESGIAPTYVPSAGLLEAAPTAAVGSTATEGQGEDEEEDPAAKRRKVLAAVGNLDADDSDDDDEDGSDDDKEAEAGKKKVDKGKGRAVSTEPQAGAAAEAGSDEDSDEDSDSDDDEDETAELLRELEKIKRERAEERARIERERAATEQTSREEEIAMGNPLLNLQSALNYGASPTPSVSSATTSSSSFGVKRRWDDDVIFKNQARGTTDKAKPEFVNDLLRSNFHRRFMKRFIA